MVILDKSLVTQAYVEYNNTYAEFTSTIDHPTRPSGWGIKGGCHELCNQ